LFCDRYKSIATQDQNYLEQLVRYIHLNPIRAGICTTIDRLNNYRWSGHRAIIYDEMNGFQEIRQVLRRFGKTSSAGRKNYLAYMKAGIGDDNSDGFVSAVRASNKGSSDKNKTECWVIGDAEFQKSVLASAEQYRLSLARYRREGIELKDVLRGVCCKMEVGEHEVLTRSTRSIQAEARKVFCYFAGSLGFPTIETGRFLGIGQAAVSHAARKGKKITDQKKMTWTVQ
jgi:putative transposase